MEGVRGGDGGKRRRQGQDLAAPPAWKRRFLDGSRCSSSGIALPILPLPEILDLDLDEDYHSPLFGEELEKMHRPLLHQTQPQSFRKSFETFQSFVSPGHIPLPERNILKSANVSITPSCPYKNDPAFAAQLSDYKQLSTTTRRE